MADENFIKIRIKIARLACASRLPPRRKIYQPARSAAGRQLPCEVALFQPESVCATRFARLRDGPNKKRPEKAERLSVRSDLRGALPSTPLLDHNVRCSLSAASSFSLVLWPDWKRSIAADAANCASALLILSLFSTHQWSRAPRSTSTSSGEKGEFTIKDIIRPPSLRQAHTLQRSAMSCFLADAGQHTPFFAARK